MAEKVVKANIFLLGVNYWPRVKAMWWWKYFDEREVTEEFRQIASLNLRLVRIFLLWEDFQPQPKSISPRAVNYLKKTFNIANTLGLQIIPTFFVGHMSGPDWMPRWAFLVGRGRDERLRISGGRVIKRRLRNIYKDPFILEAQIYQIREVVSAIGDHPALYGWDLSNEMDIVQTPESYEIGRSWVETMTSEIKRLDPGHPVTCGVRLEDIQGFPGFRVTDLTTCDLISLHVYPDWRNYPLDVGLIPQTIRRAQRTVTKPVILAEFGVPTLEPGRKARRVNIVWQRHTVRQWLYSEEEAADYYENVLTGARAQSCLGALAWCYSDYMPSFYHRLPFRGLLHERYFGITRADGTPKPVAFVLREFAKTS